MRAAAPESPVRVFVTSGWTNRMSPFPSLRWAAVMPNAVDPQTVVLAPTITAASETGMMNERYTEASACFQQYSSS